MLATMLWLPCCSSGSGTGLRSEASQLGNQAPIRTAGAFSWCSRQRIHFRGPADGGYHGSCKGTKHVAGKFGDEKGTGQLVAAAPIGGSVGLVLGGACGSAHGFHLDGRLAGKNPSAVGPT